MIDLAIAFLSIAVIAIAPIWFRRGGSAPFTPKPHPGHPADARAQRDMFEKFNRRVS